jgi:hypothetical protein
MSRMRERRSSAKASGNQIADWHGHVSWNRALVVGVRAAIIGRSRLEHVAAGKRPADSRSRSGIRVRLRVDGGLPFWTEGQRPDKNRGIP